MLKYFKPELIVYDFDGVMTNNKVYLDHTGNEIVQVNRGDGLAVAELKRLGFKQIIISTEKNEVVSTRAKKLKIDCLQGIKNKKQVLIDYCKNNDIDITFTAFVGNDINDKEAMQVVGFPLCPSDAHESIKSISNYVFKAKGGAGVVRELLDIVIEEKGE